MENNEQNLGSQEPKKGFALPANIKTIAIIAAVVIIAIIAFCMIFTRSAKSTVKEYLKAYEKGNAKKIVALMDYDGAEAYYATKSDLKKFDDKYADVKDNNKDKKDEIKESKDEMVESLEELFEGLDDDEKPKFKIKSIETSSVGGSKKLTKVKAKVTTEIDGEKDTEEITFYTVKKGLKSYIVSSPLN